LNGIPEKNRCIRKRGLSPYQKLVLWRLCTGKQTAAPRRKCQADYLAMPQARRRVPETQA